MEEKNPFYGIKTYDNYTHLWQLTLFILFLQVLSAVLVYAAERVFKIRLEAFEAMIPALLVTAYVSWAVLDGLGVSRVEAWADWKAGAGKDLVTAFKYFCGYAGLILALIAAFYAAYYFIGDRFMTVMKPVADSSGKEELEAKAAALSRVRTLLVFFSACAAAPVAEELFFRRIVYASIRRKNGFWFSASAAGLLFALFHGAAAPVIFPVGIYLCWVYERERRLPVNIMLHSMVNFSVILFKVFS